MHSGDLNGGHYFALLKMDVKWMKFDDDQVTPVKMYEVKEKNFGCESLGPNFNPSRRSLARMERLTNAYMLVYIRESEIDEVLGEVSNSCIPEHLSMYI